MLPLAIRKLHPAQIELAFWFPLMQIRRGLCSGVATAVACYSKLSKLSNFPSLEMNEHRPRGARPIPKFGTLKFGKFGKFGKYSKLSKLFLRCKMRLIHMFNV